MGLYGALIVYPEDANHQADRANAYGIPGTVNADGSFQVSGVGGRDSNVGFRCARGQ